MTAVSDDLAALRAIVPIPASFRAGRWQIVALDGGAAFTPGPVGRLLVAWIDVEGAGLGSIGGSDAASWDEVERDLGAAGAVAEYRVPAAVAVLPAPVAAQARRGDELAVAGPVYATASFETSRWRLGWAVRLDEGLAVALISA